MRTIADHVLDVAENSVNAGAKCVKLHFVESLKDIYIKIEDDGCGMDRNTFSKVFDPFFTTREKNKKFGLGLPFLKQNAELTGGYVNLKSKKGAGTTLEVTFIKNIDCPPIGDMAGTFATLVTSSRSVKWEILRCFEKSCYSFSSDMLEGVDTTLPSVIKRVFEYFKEAEKNIQKDGGVDYAHHS